MSKSALFKPVFFALALLGAVVAVAETPPPDTFAVVNGKTIGKLEFHTAYANHLRNTFYHREGVAPERLEAAKKEVFDKLVERILLLEEADRQSITPDEKKIEEAIAGYDRRYGQSPYWQQNRAALLPGLKNNLAEQSRLEQLEQRVRAMPEPSEAEVRAFYEAKPELFTEPEKLRLRTILLKVDPSSPASAWQAAREEAARLVTKLRAGADFAELARLHSQDASGPGGGDMGYLHLGMIPEALQKRIDELQIGTISDPIDVLEGVAIFRVEERVSPRRMPFADVAQRARDLLLRERRDTAWREFVARLRAAARIEVFDPALFAR